jgi:hypothetical protein
MMRSGRISFVVNVRSTRPEAMYPTISVPPRIVTSASLSSSTPLQPALTLPPRLRGEGKGLHEADVPQSHSSQT